MKPHIPLLALSLTASSLAATPPLTERLFTPETPEEFTQALAEARQKKLPKQTLLEAQFVFFIDQSNYSALAKLSQELAPLENSFDARLSQIFTLEDDWKAIIHYTQALAALEQKDAAQFEQHIKEAFWLSPRQATAFAPHIIEFKLEQAMREVTLPADLTFRSLTDNNTHPLLTPKSPANLLFYWSPWSQEFEESAQDFQALAELCAKNNIQIKAILAEHSAEVTEDALASIKEMPLTGKVLWLKEPETLELSAQLRIQTAPTLILTDAAGKIHFNGHPSSAKFWHAFQQLVPEIKRPAAR